MGASKSDMFTVRQNNLASIARALAHPARIAILEILLNRTECVCGDIVDRLPLSQSTVSQHLKALKEAGIIQGEIEGVNVCYCINEEVWNSAAKSITELFASLQSRSCC